MKRKSHWTPSAKTIVKKANTRYRKKLKMAEDRRRRLVARHTRLGGEIEKAFNEADRIKKEGPKLTPIELSNKANEEAKVARIIKMHDEEGKSFADIGKALKISHAWAHAVYVQNKGGASRNGEARKKVKKIIAKAFGSQVKKRKETPAIKEGGSWKTTDDL